MAAMVKLALPITHARRHGSNSNFICWLKKLLVKQPCLTVEKGKYLSFFSFLFNFALILLLFSLHLIFSAARVLLHRFHT